MASKIGLSCNTEGELIKELLKYMHKKDYKTSITKDPAVILNFKALENIEILGNTFWLTRRKILNLLKHIKRIGDKYV